jgi:VanZ family protein
MPEDTRERHWRLIWLVMAMLATYGSLYPFQWLDSPQPWRALLTVPGHVSRSDILGNVALFVPIGMSGALALRRWGLGGRVCVLAAGAALAVALQVAQLWTADRTAALYDAAWNGAGVLAGLLLAQAWDGPLAARLRAGASSQATIAALVVAAWIGSELVPWVPSLDWQHIKDNLRPLRGGLTGISGLAVLDACLRTLVAGEALAMAFGALGAALVVPLGGVLLIGKAVTVGQVATVSTAIGVGAGAVLTLLGTVLRGDVRRLGLSLLLPAGMAAVLLLPFDPYAPRLAPDWVPFAGLLRGDMLLNAQALAGRLFLYAGYLWLLRVQGLHPRRAAVGLALWITLLQVLRIALPGHRANVTEPLWALLCGWVVALLPLTATSPTLDAPRQRRPVAPAPVTASLPWCPRCAVLRVTGLAVGMTLILLAVLHVRALPYNVLELFRADAATHVLFVFSLALLWCGASAGWIGFALASGRSPWLFFPLAVVAAGLISLLLLYGSVTSESLLDLCGSNDLFRAVTEDGIWGTAARALFLQIGPSVVAAVERPVRYVALVGPMWFVLTFALAVQQGLRGRSALWAAVAAAPWLWLCKAIAFDGASTDNLLELIAHRGLWGFGGGVFLYGLLALVCASAALLTKRWRRPWLAPITWAVVPLAVPVGWWLLTHGLEPAVHKYGLVFSGWQFLLGPDRDQPLPDAVLFWRWAAVQSGVVLAFAAGAWAVVPLQRRPAA